MPELPEVEVVRRGLNQVTRGRQLVGGQVLLARTVAHPIFVEGFVDHLRRTDIRQWHRRGKYLLAELQRSPHTSAGWLGVHLRMTGQLLWVEPDLPLQTHCRVRLFFDNNRELRFVDQRTFGRMWWVPPDTAPDRIISGLQKLGPEPLETDFSPQYLANVLRHRQRPIKSALLDQSIVAGIGNIYADESLFLSQIMPSTSCHSLGKTRIQRLYEAIVQVLENGITAGGTTFSDFRNVQGVNGNYGGQAWVYGRAGEACQVCGTPIQRMKLAGRSTHYCSQCQR